MVMGQVGKVELFSKDLFTTEKATAGQANEWYDKVLKKQTYNLDDQSCSAKFTKDGKEQEVKLSSDDGMEDFKKLVVNPSVVQLWIKTNALAILGDIVDTGSKYLKINGNLDNTKLWVQRLKCGWNLFYQNLQQFNAAKVVPLNLNATQTSPYKVMIGDELEVITGSNSLDIDIDEEKKIYHRMKTMNRDHKYYKFEKTGFGADKKKNWNTITYSPRLITITFESGWNIQFLDFNSAILQCLKPKEDDYKKCAGSSAKKLEYKDVLAYLEKVNNAMFKFKEDTLKEKTWRTLRTTISPFNSDVGDAQFYFQEFTSGTKKINLFKTMKERSVEIFIASSINNAQVISLPYEVTYKANDPAKCDDKAAAIQGCYQTQPKKWNEAPKASQECDTKLQYDLPVRDMTNDSVKTTMLHVFIVGNSGKDLVPVKGGKLTGGLLVWNRSIKQTDGKVFNRGFMRLIFAKDYVEAKYYEIRSTDQVMQEVVKFTVAPHYIPKKDEVEKFLKAKCQ